ncbi:MAG TPA: permease-like cell division protein FtsX [Symbiobacteriaceae bacterium]|nr:permease-like cell division protein FtsX [Symbiobacteriaceae bacterium]
MNLRAWVTAVRDALRSMTQSSLMSLASIATVAVSLLVLSVVLLLALNLDMMAASVEKEVQIKAYLCTAQDSNPTCNKQELKDDQKKILIDKVRQIPGVKAVTYVSKEEALQKMKEEFGEQKDILEGLEGENPLRDSLEIEARDVSLVDEIAQNVMKTQGISDVNYGQAYVKTLMAFTRAIRFGGVGLVLMLIIATVLTISNTIRLAVYARRREIAIMKLVGATDWFIRRPFMMEGIFLGVFGALIAMGLTGYGYRQVVVYMDQNIPFWPVARPEHVLMNQTLGLVVLGGVLGAVGSLISMRRFLKV